MGSIMFSKFFKGSVEKLVMESLFVLNEDPLMYHGIYYNLFEFMETKCPTSNDKNEAWEKFLELVEENKVTCENSIDTMRQRHKAEDPSIHLQKALNFAVNERGGVRNNVDYKALTDTFTVIVQDLKKTKKNLDGNDFYSLFQIVNLFSYSEFNPALQYFWKIFHSSEKRSKKKKIPRNSTVASFQEAYDLVKDEQKRCFLCNDFKRKTCFKIKFLKQHLSSFHSIYSYTCDWNGCTETFRAWRYLTHHKQRFHNSKQKKLAAKEDKENEDKLHGQDESKKKKRSKAKQANQGSPAKKVCRTKDVAAKQVLEKRKPDETPSPINNEYGTIRILNFDPSVLPPMCEKVINHLCAIVESYDSTIKISTPFTYDVTTGILDRKVQIDRKLQVPIDPVLSSPEQFIPGLSIVQQEVEL